MTLRQMAAPPDGGYGWVVLAACIVCQGTVASLQRITGLIIVEIIDLYDVNRTEAFSLLVVCRFFGFIFAPVFGKLLTKFQYRIILCIGCLFLSLSLILTSFSTAYWQLMVFFGCLRGAATNCVMISSSLTVGLYFHNRRTFAMGLYYSAMGCAGFISPMVFHWLRDTYQFQGTILILGGIFLHGCACSILVRQPTWVMHTRMEEHVELIETQLDKNFMKDKQSTISLQTYNNNGYPTSTNNELKSLKPEVLPLYGKPDQPKSTLSQLRSVVEEIQTDLCLFKDGYFLLQLFSRALFTITPSYFLSLLPDYVEDEFEHHISKQDIAYMLSMSSIGDIAATFGIGVVQDRLPWRKITSLAVTVILTGITVFTFQFMQNYSHLMVGVVLFSLWRGTNLVMQQLVEMETMGLQRVHMARGLNRFIVGFATVFTGLLIGYLRDQLGSYKVCISILAGSSLLGGLVWTAEPIVLKYFPTSMRKM